MGFSGKFGILIRAYNIFHIYWTHTVGGLTTAFGLVEDRKRKENTEGAVLAAEPWVGGAAGGPDSRRS